MAVLNPFSRKRRPPKPGSRRIREESEITLPGTGFTFLFRRDGCRTLRMTVKPDGSVCVKSPAALPLERVLSFVRSRLDWVQEKRTFFAEHRGVPVSAEEGAPVLYLGRVFLLRRTPWKRHARARFVGNVLELPCLRPGADDNARAEAADRALRRWRLETAKLVLARRLERMAAMARTVLGDDAVVFSLTVRFLRRRWGSCSVRGNITLAAQLTEMPLPLIDYVLCHELCHLRAMNHGAGFHALLRTLLPDAAKRERLIHIWGLEHPRR